MNPSSSRRRLSGWPLVAVAAGLAALLAACDLEVGDPSDFSITVEPKTTSLRQGQSQQFIAYGGNSYTWSIDTSSTQRWAILDRTDGGIVVYTSLHSETNSTNLLVLTVTSSIGGDSTNSQAYSATAEAYIYHVP
ncbi:MAG: hypothetical protein E4H02_05710 [Lentisphaerales bacterium]|jgi:hypothetical protein|nr:MAG: hypothetical protein E4H02_05710 [Lentisphaerales bacterium]